jgi:hypothetical protein
VGQAHTFLVGAAGEQKESVCLADFISPYDSQRIAFRIGDERFGQPLANIFLALNARRLQIVDAQTADDGDQECSRGPEITIRGLLPADKRVLHHVLGVRDRSNHAVGN